MKRVGLVTGGTGLLGSWIIRQLVELDFKRVYVLAREDKNFSPENRVLRILAQHSKGKLCKIRRRLEVIRGNLLESGLGIPVVIRRRLVREVTDVFHSAALAEFRVVLERIRACNVEGTKKVLDFTLEATRSGNPEIKLHHVSTIAIAGTHEGWFSEEQFDLGQNFNNTYERTKFEAEKLIREAQQRGLRANIYRPGIITGDSRHGVTTNFKMIYQPLHFIAQELFSELPADSDCLHSFVPVDKVAEAICLLSLLDDTRSTWHLTNPRETKLDFFFDAASEVFRSRKPELIPLAAFDKDRLSAVQWQLLDPFVPYLNYRLRFAGSTTRAVLNSLGFEWPEMDRVMLKRLFKFCLRSGFGKHG